MCCAKGFWCSVLFQFLPKVLLLVCFAYDLLRCYRASESTVSHEVSQLVRLPATSRAVRVDSSRAAFRVNKSSAYCTVLPPSTLFDAIR